MTDEELFGCKPIDKPIDEPIDKPAGKSKKPHRENSRRPLIFILVCAVLILSFVIRVAVISPNQGTTISKVGAQIGIKPKTTSLGQTMGDVYSVDGYKLTQTIEYESKIYEVEDEKLVLKDAKSNGESEKIIVGQGDYFPILGAENRFGALLKLSDVLHSFKTASNRSSLRGDDITLTISHKGQQKAIEILNKYKGIEEAKHSGTSTISVVLGDGSVLVSAKSANISNKDIQTYFTNEGIIDSLNKIIKGNNSKKIIKEAQALLDKYEATNKELDRKFTNPATEAKKVGSATKPLSIATMMTMNDQFTNEAFRLENTQYNDTNYVRVGDFTIHNSHWNDDTNGKYTTLPGTEKEHRLRNRTIDLSKAMIYSANTYVVSHADNLGFEKVYEKMSEYLLTNNTIQTEICSFKNNPMEGNRYPYYFFGQDFEASPILVCTYYNYIFGGDFNNPFYVAQATNPNGKVSYNAKKELIRQGVYNLDDDNILKNALTATTQAYKDVDAYIKANYPSLEGRVLCKSGTSEIIKDKDINNSSMAMVILSADKKAVLATAYISFNRVYKGVNAKNRIASLLEILEASGVIERG